MFRDRELIQLLRDEPELLPIADAVSATQWPLWRRRRLRRLAPTLVVGVVLAGAAAVLALQPLTGSKGGIVEQALGAIPGEGSVTHVLARRRAPTTGLVSLATGREVHEMIELELWFDPGQKRLRTVVRRNGAVVTDILQRSTVADQPAVGDLETAASLASDGAIPVFAVDYRAALQARRATLVRSEAADDRPTLLVRSRFGSLQRVTLDRQRQVPVRVRHVAADGLARGPAWQVVTTELLHGKNGLFSPRGKPLMPSGGRVLGSLPVSMLRARVVLLPARALWAGRRVRGLPLSALALQTLTRTYPDGAKLPTRSRGLELLYGDVERGRPDRQGRFLQIQQAATPEPAYGSLAGRLAVEPLPPPGHLRLERRGAIWKGRMRRLGLHVTLAASDRETLLAGARSLRPIPRP